MSFLTAFYIILAFFAGYFAAWFFAFFQIRRLRSMLMDYMLEELIRALGGEET